MSQTAFFPTKDLLAFFTTVTIVIVMGKYCIYWPSTSCYFNVYYVTLLELFVNYTRHIPSLKTLTRLKIFRYVHVFMQDLRQGNLKYFGSAEWVLRRNTKMNIFRN
jgi:hypothetical protein